MATKKSAVDAEANEQYLQLKRELKKLQKHELDLDRHIDHLENHKNELKRDHAYARYAYVTYEDLEFLNRNRELRADEETDEEANESSQGSHNE